MKSKTSLYNKAIFQKNMLRFWPIWAAALFFAIIYPIGHLMSVMNNKNNLDLNYIVSTASDLYGVATQVVPYLTYCYVVVVSMAVWSYLFSARSISLLHSLPITRKSLYVTNLLSGLTMLLCPYFIFAILYQLVDASQGAGDIAAMFFFLLTAICEAVFLFSIATLSAMITGNIIVLPVFYIIINYLAVGLETIISDFASGFIYGYSGGYVGYFEFLSPFEFLRNNLYYSVDPFSSYVTINGLQYSCIYGLVGIVILIISYYLYKFRQSETSGDTLCFKILRPVIYCLFSGVFAFLFGRTLYDILGFNEFYYAKLPITVFCLLGGIIGFFISRMIIHKSLAVFNKKALPGLLTTLSIVLIICLIGSLDVFNLENHIPDNSEIKVAYLSFDGCNYELKEAEDINLLKDLHRSYLADKEMVVNAPSNGGYYTATITYKLKKGGEVSRSYPFRPDDENFQNSQSGAALQAFLEDPQMLLRNMDYLESYGSFDYCDIWGEFARAKGFENRHDIQDLFDAVKADIREGNYKYVIGYKSSHDNLFLEFQIVEPYTTYRAVTHFMKFSISSSMHNTIETLAKNGWIFEVDAFYFEEGELELTPVETVYY